MEEQASAVGLFGEGPQGDLGDQSKAAPTAAEEPHQVVAGHVFHHLATCFGLGAVRPHHLQTDHLIADPQVALAKATGHATGDKPTDRSALASIGPAPPGPVDGEPLLAFRQGALQFDQGQTGFNGHGEVAAGVMQQPVQLGGA